MDGSTFSSATITLYIKDIKSLRGSIDRMHVFTTEGGSFGCEPISVGNHWLLQDSAQKVKPLNANIIWSDG